ncbi:hypothetical protein V6N11_053084 [Hibiscus sabdariffa]|uniref:Uncharacterized protein n=1 Tax=Hibiscus sabdariffa TaxID=183260 RepID=A0ABR2UC98_9ROSI
MDWRFFTRSLGPTEQGSLWNVIAHWQSTGSIIQPCVLRSLALWLGSARTVLKQTLPFFDISRGSLTWKQIALLKRESNEGVPRDGEAGAKPNVITYGALVDGCARDGLEQWIVLLMGLKI